MNCRVIAIAGNRRGLTLIEALVAMAVFVAIMGMTATCLCTSMTLCRDGRQDMRVQQLGTLFTTQIEGELRSASSVVASDSGANIAFRDAAGQAVAYEFDSEALNLTRHVRASGDLTDISDERVFPDDFCVKSCSFQVKNGFASVCLTVTDDSNQDRRRVSANREFYVRVALRALE